jgi:hypothetical protein
MIAGVTIFKHFIERHDPRFSDQLAVDSKNVITHKNKGVHDEEKLQQCL